MVHINSLCFKLWYLFDDAIKVELTISRENYFFTRKTIFSDIRITTYACNLLVTKYNIISMTNLCPITEEKKNIAYI